MPTARAVKVGPSNPRSVARESGSSRRWWFSLLLQPLLLLTSGAMLLAGLGVAQRLGWISAGGNGGGHSHAAAGSQAVSYICPMMCTPPQSEPGRCPICAMELVPAAAGGGGSSTSIEIDSVARRIANIQTVAVESTPVSRSIRAVGELAYDEGTLKTISAYVDGRLDRLYADYTGVVVKEGDHLALVYSPHLYSGQVELLLAGKAVREQRAAASRFNLADDSLYETARTRLLELGMSGEQIGQLEAEGKASSRMHLCAPAGGTVIEKLAVEGQYVKEGQAIYRLADLSTVWLMLELFPEDAAAVRYGQQVRAVVQSLPDRPFAGRVAFIDPQVDPRTRTVAVRVVIANNAGLLRVGDFAKATIEVPPGAPGGEPAPIFDPQLADKWISPRHPHVIASSPGDCPICGVKLVPAARFGFTDQPTPSTNALVIPRSAVLMAGDYSVVYVEIEPGRFEIRRVVPGPQSGDRIVILEGIRPGEIVATKGNFLIDSQMQLAGNPSLIDPTRAVPNADSPASATIIAALEKLAPDDRRLAERQRICPVADMRLGSMGPPQKIDVNGTPVFICCAGCRESLLAEPGKYLQKLKSFPSTPAGERGMPAMDLPPIGPLETMEPDDSLPPIEAIQLLESTAPADRVTAGHREVMR